MSWVRRLHRYLGVALAVVWSVQIMSGVISVFHRELDAVWLDKQAATFDREKFSAAFEQLHRERSPGRFSSVYTAVAGTGQFDVFLHTEDDGLQVLRLDGHGKLLREQAWAVDLVRVSFLQNVRLLHETLLAGARADLVVGLSGVFLLATIILGLRLAWPRQGQWQRALFPAARGPTTARLRAWHRAIGLWLAVPALIVIATGLLTVWEDAVGHLVGDYAPQPTGTAQLPLTADRLPLSTVLDIAFEKYPASTLSIISLPAEGQPWYRVRLRQPGEVRRLFGMTTIYIRADSGAVLASYEPQSMTPARRAANAIYAIHTGTVGGLPTRILNLLTGIMLVGSMALGIAFWSRRRRPAQSKG